MLFKEDWRPIIEALLKFPGIRSQLDLERKGDIPRGTVSRYKRGRLSPDRENFRNLGEAVGMDEEQFKGFCAAIWSQTYPAPSSDLLADDTVREPRAVYGGPTLVDRARRILDIDLTGLPPEIAFDLHRLRQEIGQIVEDHDQKSARLQALLRIFEDLYRSLASASRSQR